MAEFHLIDLPEADHFAKFQQGVGQRFVVTVESEGYHDEAKSSERRDNHTNGTPRLAKFQQFCEGFGVSPIYFLDYATATSKIAMETLVEPLANGRAELGIQYHASSIAPFVGHGEDIGNAEHLRYEFECEKFRQLRDAIETNFGHSPLIHRAGRNEVKPFTGQLLKDFGIPVDSSVRSRFDYTRVGGPNFHNHPVVPYWLDQPGGLLELPLTAVYWGPMRQLGRMADNLIAGAPRLRSWLARTDLLDRIPFAPEGVSVEEAIHGIDIALDEGLPLLVFSFHLPSLSSAYGNDVENEDGSNGIYGWWRAIFSYLAQRKVLPTNIKGIMSSVTLA